MKKLLKICMVFLLTLFLVPSAITFLNGCSLHPVANDTTEAIDEIEWKDLHFEMAKSVIINEGEKFIEPDFKIFDAMDNDISQRFDESIGNLTKEVKYRGISDSDWSKITYNEIGKPGYYKIIYLLHDNSWKESASTSYWFTIANDEIWLMELHPNLKDMIEAIYNDHPEYESVLDIEEIDTREYNFEPKSIVFEGLNNFNNLKRIYISGMYLNEVNLYDLPTSLTTLYLPDNDIRAFRFYRKDKNENDNLTYVDVSHNNIELLPTGKNGLFSPNNLECLDISYNKLDRSVLESLGFLRKYKYINLSYNNLKIYYSDVEEYFDGETIWNIKGNLITDYSKNSRYYNYYNNLIFDIQPNPESNSISKTETSYFSDVSLSEMKILMKAVWVGVQVLNEDDPQKQLQIVEENRELIEALMQGNVDNSSSLVEDTTELEKRVDELLKIK